MKIGGSSNNLLEHILYCILHISSGLKQKDEELTLPPRLTAKRQWKPLCRRGGCAFGSFEAVPDHWEHTREGGQKKIKDEQR